MSRSWNQIRETLFFYIRVTSINIVLKYVSILYKCLYVYITDVCIWAYMQNVFLTVGQSEKCLKTIAPQDKAYGFLVH